VVTHIALLLIETLGGSWVENHPREAGGGVGFVVPRLVDIVLTHTPTAGWPVIVSACMFICYKSKIDFGRL